jgi:hypothetical protein
MNQIVRRFPVVQLNLWYFFRQFRVRIAHYSQNFFSPCSTTATSIRIIKPIYRIANRR